MRYGGALRIEEGSMGPRGNCIAPTHEQYSHVTRLHLCLEPKAVLWQILCQSGRLRGGRFRQLQLMSAVLNRSSYWTVEVVGLHWSLVYWLVFAHDQQARVAETT